MIPEIDLERHVLQRVQKVKESVAGWEDPVTLAQTLGIRVAFGSLGPEREGAALDGMIVIDQEAGVPSRVRFTFYHEIMHQLIHEDDEFYSVLHDQYEDDNDLSRFSERLANIGAAEFLVPREAVLVAAAKHGFSLSLLRDLQQSSLASPTALCVQIGLCAPHKCVAVVTRRKMIARTPSQATLVSEPAHAFAVEVSVSSRSMNYSVARGTPIPANHFLRGALSADEGQILNGKDLIPFRNRESAWPVECEAVRVGGQVFALFHASARPGPTINQLVLDI
jgi:hypothetical protein